jgi:hypothetical protein
LCGKTSRAAWYATASVTPERPARRCRFSSTTSTPSSSRSVAKTYAEPSVAALLLHGARPLAAVGEQRSRHPHVAGEQASIDPQHDARDPDCVLGGEEERGARDVVGLPNPAGVRIEPGAIAFARIPCRPNSTAVLWVRLINPAFAALYASYPSAIKR